MYVFVGSDAIYGYGETRKEALSFAQQRGWACPNATMDQFIPKKKIKSLDDGYILKASKKFYDIVKSDIDSYELNWWILRRLKGIYIAYTKQEILEEAIKKKGLNKIKNIKWIKYQSPDFVVDQVRYKNNKEVVKKAIQYFMKMQELSDELDRIDLKK
jgi:hypothetical protein